MVMLYFAEGRSMVVGHYDIAKSCFVSVCLPFQLLTLLEKYPNTEFFLVRMFPHSDGIRRDSPNTGKYGAEKNPYFDTFHAV